jgi:hypothetical protein
MDSREEQYHSLSVCIPVLRSQIHLQIHVSLLQSVGCRRYLITSKVLDVRRRGATTEAYGVIRRKPVVSLKVEREERSLARLWREGNPPEADKRSPSTLLRAMSLSNGR